MSAENEIFVVQLARLEERMNTVQAEYKTDIARLAEDAAKRDKQSTFMIVGVLLGSLALATTILISVLG